MPAESEGSPCDGNSSSSSSSSSGSTIGNLIERSETKYDDRGRVHRTIRYAVDRPRESWATH
ncbi:hypothetical protein GC176_18010 [bacterium]|nr:hypothetical protein [bacterium]